MPATIKSSDLVRLRQKIAADRKRLDEQEKAVAMVEAMLREQQSTTSQAELPMEAPVPKQKRFGEQVREAVKGFGLSEEFAVADVEAVMIRNGVLLPLKNPRSRIAMVVQDMRERGLLVRTEAAKGQPHRYRRVLIAKRPEIVAHG